jgi:hypothetical protein
VRQMAPSFLVRITLAAYAMIASSETENDEIFPYCPGTFVSY